MAEGEENEVNRKQCLQFAPYCFNSVKCPCTNPVSSRYSVEGRTKCNRNLNTKWKIFNSSVILATLNDSDSLRVCKPPEYFFLYHMCRRSRKM